MAFYKQGHLLNKRHLLERGDYLKMPVLERHLLDTDEVYIIRQWASKR